MKQSDQVLPFFAAFIQDYIFYSPKQVAERLIDFLSNFLF